MEEGEERREKEEGWWHEGAGREGRCRRGGRVCGMKRRGGAEDKTSSRRRRGKAGVCSMRGRGKSERKGRRREWKREREKAAKTIGKGNKGNSPLPNVLQERLYH